MKTVTTTTITTAPAWLPICLVPLVSGLAWLLSKIGLAEYSKTKTVTFEETGESP